MTVIADSGQLAEFCARQAEASYITIDTEFLRDSTYFPKLCLVQLSGPEETAAIDPLAEGIDLDPLIALFDNPNLVKVVHSGRQDFEIFYQLTGRLPAPVFDTQVAAMVCGFGESVGYDTLVRKLTGQQIDKSSRFTDWSRRPLAERQINYALSDVTHLRPVYEKLKRKLDKTGRAGWLDAEMEILTSPDTYASDPMNAWTRLKSRSNDRRYLAVLRGLAAWRDSEAQRRDQPRNRVLRDEQLYDIAAHRPGSTEELARTRGVNADMARGKIGRGILAAVEEALALPKEDWPVPMPRIELPDGLGPLVELLKVLLKLRCEEQRVALKLVASGQDLERIAADDTADVRALSGWRREIFGADALRLKHGKIALSAEDNKIRIVDLESR